MANLSTKTPPPGRSQSPSQPITLISLGDPPISQIDGVAMDLFVMELVQTLSHSSSVAIARQKEFESEMVESGLIPPPPLPGKQANVYSSGGKARDSSSSLAKEVVGEKDEAEEAVRVRLESIGLHVGANFSERLCRDRPLLHDTLEVVKFICKDVWIACWDKQIDNLRTNHRGVYVLTDNQFKPILRISSWESRADAIRRSKIYTAMAAGLIKGVLSRLGYHCSVHSEVTSLPACTFQVKIPTTK